jgi:hypothetical protein
MAAFEFRRSRQFPSLVLGTSKRQSKKLGNPQRREDEEEGK